MNHDHVPGRGSLIIGPTVMSGVTHWQWPRRQARAAAGPSQPRCVTVNLKSESRCQCSRVPVAPSPAGDAAQAVGSRSRSLSPPPGRATPDSDLSAS
jgi:hypothetical protein